EIVNAPASFFLHDPCLLMSFSVSLSATHSLRDFRTAVSDPEPGLPAYVSCDSDSGLYKPRAQWIKDNVGADYWERGTKLQKASLPQNPVPEQDTPRTGDLSHSLNLEPHLGLGFGVFVCIILLCGVLVTKWCLSSSLQHSPAQNAIVCLWSFGRLGF
uniref:MHC class I antigen n=1 Tax=Chrysemys picta bellii TaxID=8478 RepID=A0A8C3FLS1_CHRPI